MRVSSNFYQVKLRRKFSSINLSSHCFQNYPSLASNCIEVGFAFDEGSFLDWKTIATNATVKESSTVDKHSYFETASSNEIRQNKDWVFRM